MNIQLEDKMPNCFPEWLRSFTLSSAVFKRMVLTIELIVVFLMNILQWLPVIY